MLTATFASVAAETARLLGPDQLPLPSRGVVALDAVAENGFVHDVRGEGSTLGEPM